MAQIAYRARGYTTHAAERALERFGLVLTPEIAQAMIRMINDGKYIRVQPFVRIYHYELAYDGAVYPIVYCPVNRQIITFQTQFGTKGFQKREERRVERKRWVKKAKTMFEPEEVLG